MSTTPAEIGPESFDSEQFPALTHVDAATWQALVDALPANIAALDAAGCIVAVNEGWMSFARENSVASAALAKLGPGANYLDACRRAGGAHSEGARVCLAGLQRVLNGREPYFEHEYPCHSRDRQRWYLLRAAPLRRRSGGAVVAHFDVTHRRQSELALRQDLHAATQLIKAMPAGLFIYERRPPDRLVLVDANPEAEWLTGATLERWLGEEFDALWPQARDKGITEALLNVIDGGEVYEADDQYFSDELLHRSFRLRGFRIDRHRLGLAIEDVTEQRLAEQALRRTTTMLNNILASSSEYAIVATDADLRITHYNPAAERLFLIPAAEAVGRSVVEIHEMHNVHREKVAEALRCVEQDGKWEGVLQIRQADGQIRHIRPVVTPMFDETGQRAGLVLLARDITERVAAGEVRMKNEE